MSNKCAIIQMFLAHIKVLHKNMFNQPKVLKLDFSLRLFTWARFLSNAGAKIIVHAGTVKSFSW